MFEESNHINDDLLIRYLLEETNPAEREAVEAWLQADDSNRKQFEDYKMIWEESRRLASDKYIDEEQAWQRMQQRLRVKEAPAAPVKKINFTRISRAAAVWILLIAGLTIAGLYIWKSQPPQTLIVKSDVRIIRDTLPDGSIVTLNKGATLSYPESFKGNTREISLKGEAFFNVTPDKSKPFIIKTGDLSIRVVGTSFNVRNNNGNTEVVVETGIVQVSRKSQTVKLGPKEKLVAKAEETVMTKEAVEDKLYNYYASKEFVCVNTPLWKLVDVLNEAYDVHIVIADKRERRLPLTTTFNNESLDKILLVISQTFNITVERSGDTILLN